jgi:hypothetical protein
LDEGRRRGQGQPPSTNAYTWDEFQPALFGAKVPLLAETGDAKKRD